MSVSDEEREFWNEIILNDDGTVDLEAVYAELSDYRFVMQEAAKVYYDITCGQLSKPNYYASSVISVANECAERITREEVLGVLMDIDDGTITLHDALMEYTETVLDPDAPDDD